MGHFIETERLILREFEESDVEGMFAMDSDPAVHVYLGNKPVKNLEQSLSDIRFIQQQYKEFGVGRLAVILKESNEFIGWGGFKYINTYYREGYTNYYDLGYRFAQKYWGNGYGYETALSTLQYGFDQMNLNKIIGIADQANLGSCRILEKIGLIKTATFEFENVPCNWYELDQKEYLKIKQTNH